MEEFSEIGRVVEEGGLRYHPELHADVPDQRDDGVHAWFDRKDRLETYPSEELEAVKGELHAMPEVAGYEDEKVSIDTIANAMALAVDLTPPTERLSLAPKELVYTGLVEQLETCIDRYTDTIRRFEHLHILFFRDAEKYKQSYANVDQARRSSHSTLIEHLRIMSRFLSAIPRQAGKGFDVREWENYLKEHWFSHDQLTTDSGRKEITEWAVRMDIARKAQAIEAVIDEVLEKKKADGGEIPAPA